MWFSSCVCWVWLVSTLPVYVEYIWYIFPVYVEYVWYIILLLLDVILYETCIVCTVCLVCIGPGAWGGRWVQLIFGVGSIPGFVQWNFAWRFPYWDGISLEVSALRWNLSGDNCIEVYLAKVSRYILWEIFANIYVVRNFANMDSDWKFSALRWNLPGGTCIEVYLAEVSRYILQ